MPFSALAQHSRLKGNVIANDAALSQSAEERRGNFRERRRAPNHVIRYAVYSNGFDVNCALRSNKRFKQRFTEMIQRNKLNDFC